jgi:transmembrane 9 superfamily protein 2/4
MTSTKTAIPYDYYSLPFCKPFNKNPKAQVENFGEILWGDSIKPSLYAAHMGVNVTCRRLCNPRTYDAKEMQAFQKRIEEGYRGHLILDNLPVSEVFTQKIKGFRSFMLGYPLGTPKTTGKQKKSKLPLPVVPVTILNNHLALTIKYNRPEDLVTSSTKGFRIVGFHVVAHSYKHDETTCVMDDRKNVGWFPKPGNPVTVEDKDPVVWSYSITWLKDEALGWGSRWDPYLESAETDAKIHWFSIVNSLLIMLFLSGMVAMILLRSLHKDFNRYNDPDNADEAQEETGWKLVHGDVFRTPENPSILATYIGTGCQLLGMALITIFFALLGFLSPANRGGLLTAVLLLFILLGSYAGYVTARLCKMFRCHSWQNIFMVGTFFPGQVFVVFFAMDMMLWGKHASNAVPATTMLALLALWLCVSLPLVFVGAIVGYKRPTIEPPVTVNPMPRHIPEQRWYMRPPFTILMAGILPFGAAFIELFFILSSLWLNRFYYVFGFLALVFIILSITCAEITIVMVYFQLCYEDYRWWWRSFFISGSSGIHLFLYSIFYFFTTLTIRQFWSTVLYFSWMIIVSYTFAIVTGTIGFLASFFFVRYIYASIKVD